MVSTKFGRQFLATFPHTPKIAQTSLGNVQEEMVHNIRFSIGKVRAQINVAYIGDLGGGAEAAIGVPFFKLYRVTIDYPRQKVLLQPFSRPTSH